MKNLILLIFLCGSNALANVVGVDAQNFNPTSNGLDFVTVQSSETLEPGIFNLGLFLNYAVNTLPNYENSTTQSTDSPQDKLLSMDFSVGLGLMKNWDIGLTIPQVLSQEVEPNSTVFRGQFESTGLTEIRLNTKYRFFGDHNGGLAAIGTINYFLLENYPFTGSNPGPTLNLELAYDFTYEKVNIGINAGYRARNPGDPIPGIPVEPKPDEALFSVAGSYLISSIDTKIIAEIYNSIPVEKVKFSSDRELSSSEILVGFKHDLRTDLALHAGLGTEISHGSSSPDLRIYTGINWAFGPVFGKQYSDYQSQLIKKSGPTVVFIDDVDFSALPSSDQETFIAKDVLFDFNSSKVSESFDATLRALAKYLQKGKGFKSLIIVGHTDSVGRMKYNDGLSVRRARSVAQRLIAMLPQSEKRKVSAQGRGEREPIANNGNYQGRALNRRVEFKIQR